MVVFDNIQELVDLLIAQWNNSNTSGKTPNIGKITDYPFEMDYMDGKGYVVIYSLLENESMPGIGETTKADVQETVKVDARVIEDELYFQQVKAEIKRILYSFKPTGTTNICNFDLDNKSITNLSNRMKKFYREVRELTLVAYNRDYSA